MFATTRPWTAATTAVVTALAFAGLYLAVVHTQAGQLVDHELMRMISSAFGVTSPVEGALGRYQLPMLAAGGLLVAGVVASRRAKTVAVSAVLVLSTTVVGAYVLKALLERRSFGIGPELNSFPSNTVAVVAALAVILVGSAARRYRTAAFLVAAATGSVVSVLVVAQQWHRPGDVLGAWLVAVGAAAVVRVGQAAWAWTSDVEGSLTGGQAAAHRG
ncbi:phosphatase PAP2 family protein [Tsukamurella sp. PLM1]|uniref:phosphatase PAP2 family protein n=1 Tax=Tsukamurella sp. PLM1 TaxID=2929795 RepID=UPI0020C0C794|nr:phosphatase PAP2 family protein [Tsukamurella sp. PLM1]